MTETNKRFIRTIAGEIYDIENDSFIHQDYVGKPIEYEDECIKLLNEQAQKIKELEHELSELHLEKGSAEYYKQLAEEYFEEISKLTYKLNKIKDDIER